MEILIIGGIIVALMVVVSTRIKKNAAKAFEPETIRMDEFSIEKPEGFLYPLHDEPEFPFEAYSKLYGERSTRNIWRARARLRIHEGRKLASLLAEIRQGGEDELSREGPYKTHGGERVLELHTDRTLDEVDYLIFRKFTVLPEAGKTYELRITMLRDYADEYRERAQAMMAGFSVNRTDKQSNPL